MQIELTLLAPPGADYSARDLGFLLHKNPDNVHERSTTAGRVSVFYTEADAGRTTAVIYLDLDPIGLVRGRNRQDPGLLSSYVNDRPYVANSFLSVALGRTLGQSIAGKSKQMQDLADRALPLESRIVPVAASGDMTRDATSLIDALFAPLGYQVEIRKLSEEEGTKRGLFDVRLKGTVCLGDLLKHLYVLIPVLDNAKHFWVDRDEMENLLSKGDDWLPSHPEKDLITRRALRYRGGLVETALTRLSEGVAIDDADDDQSSSDKPEQDLEAPIKLHDLRLDTVTSLLQDQNVRSVLDLGCGEGKLLARLLKERGIDRIVGVDASVQSLAHARRRLRLDRAGEAIERRLSLQLGSLTYGDRRWQGFDAATLVEVIEHIDPPRLSSLELSVFGDARPRLLILTTPNRDYNVLFETMPAGTLRHADHRFGVDARRVRELVQACRRNLWLQCSSPTTWPCRRASRRTLADGSLRAQRRDVAMKISIPDFALVVLVGPTGCGKSSFAKKHFLDTEIVSSDHCRAVVSDDETDQAATSDAFDLLQYTAGVRLRRRKLTVIDATSVRREDRAHLIRLARTHHALPVALVLDIDPEICHERNQERANRAFGPHVARNHSKALRRGLRGLQKEGFRQIQIMKSPEDVEALEISREPLWTDRRADHGPFDIIGDIHGCFDELVALLDQLGYFIDPFRRLLGRSDQGAPPRRTHCVLRRRHHRSRSA